MALPPGTRLGPYEVGVPIGAGGMGEVYRATDTNLKRPVAVKVLPPAVATTAGNLARFQREAEVLALLNHPNIASIYGLERTDGAAALVMELVEGPTLADRIARAPIPVEEALSIAKQIAEALEAAHEQGIIHRDLKPANVKVRPDGVVKVLDFGLAKAFEPAGALSTRVIDSPTITAPALTGIGALLGTAAYMSPEQASGKVVDKRTDIWAFGCVVYEMLTGRRAFPGDEVSNVLASVLTREPDWSLLPAGLSSVRISCIKRCLHKDRKQRIRDIGDVLLAVDGAFDTEVLSAARRVRDARRRWLPAVGLAIVTVVAAVQTARLWRFSGSVSPEFEFRLEIVTPPPPTSGLTGPRSLAISPDGSKVVFTALVERQVRLWLRSLDSSIARSVPGTEAAVLPFWAPDSRSVGFFANGQLKRLDVVGGTIRTLASAPFGLGGAWNTDGTIVFAPIFSGPLHRISAEGGEPAVLTQLAAGQRSHRTPQFLPDGRRFLFVADGPDGTSIHVGDLDGSPTRRLVDAELADVHYPSSRLLFLRQGTLFSQQLDESVTLTGNPQPLAEQVAAMAASRAGPIIYRTLGRAGRRQFVWMDRKGNEITRVGGPREEQDPGDLAMSPDGRYVALQRSVDGNADIWLLETARGVLSRFTTEPVANYSGRFSPDGKRVSYSSSRSGVLDLYAKSASGDGNEELLLATPQNKSPSDWSPDGRFLLFRSVDPVTSHDLWALPLDGRRQPFPVVRTNFVEAFGQFSPDGRWIAYQSDETGREEVYVQPFPGPGPKLHISTQGGAQMRWRRDGKEMFYLALDGRMMAVQMRSTHGGARLEASEPEPLFTARVGEIVPLQSGYLLSYVVSPDGQRFLMNEIVEEPAAMPVTVLLNWKPNR
jgi:Tol biopolymer transport system component